MSGILYRQFALTIAVSVLISAFVALTLTPAMCASILNVHKPNDNPKGIYKFFQKFNDAFDSSSPGMACAWLTCSFTSMVRGLPGHHQRPHGRRLQSHADRLCPVGR